MSSEARLLPTKMVEKVWGRDSLPAPFAAPANARIGEIWFEPPSELSEILVKYLFTSEKLSVQVHPSDTSALPGENGKEECWLVLDAEPGAALAIGFEDELSKDEIAAAARDGSIEQLLTWHEVSAGDIYFLPPGTVHAIGPGLSLVEVQQNSDTTFRLYDYGRPRELHLERSLAVLEGRPYPAQHKGTIAERGTELIASDCFRLDRVEAQPLAEIYDAYRAPLLALPLAGSVKTKDAATTAKAGECLFAADIDAIDFEAAEVTLLTRAQPK